MRPSRRCRPRSGLVRPTAAQDVGAAEGSRCHMVGWCFRKINNVVREWSSGQLYPPGGCKLQRSKWERARERERERKKVQFWVTQWKAEGIWTAATVASRKNIDRRYQMPGESRSTENVRALIPKGKKAPWGFVEMIWWDCGNRGRVGKLSRTSWSPHGKTDSKGIGLYTDPRV